MAQADTVTPRDLLFAAFAVRERLVEPSDLAETLPGWSGDPSATLADRLLARGGLDPTEVERVEALVDRHAGATHPGPAASASTTAATLGSDDGRTGAFTPGRTEPDPAGATDPEATEPASAGHPGPGPAPGGRGQAERYRILRPHAQGGLGTVSVALDAELNREVALKQILGRHADEPASRARFLAEAEITGGLEHPGIVPVYGLGFDREGRPYYAMRFVRGGTLKDAIARFHADPAPRPDPGARSLALRELLRRFGDACNAVDYAHGRGVLHRDLKPSNIIVGRHGETLIVDWGLAKATGRGDGDGHAGLADGESPLVPVSSGGSARTLPGSALGTPAFMSPEAAAGDLEGLGPRSDVYSLGATLYCILAGRPPFEGADLAEVLGRVRLGNFAPPRRIDPAVDPALEAICLKAMSLRPGGRYGSAGELAGDLLRWSADEPVAAYPEGRGRRLCRWARRHTALVAGVGALLATASVSLAVAAGLLAEARDLLDARNEQLAVAFRESEKSRMVASNGFLAARTAIREQLTRVARSDLPAIPQAENLRLQLAREAARLYRQIYLQDPASPVIKLDYAQVEEQVAGLCRMTGRYPEAREHYEAVLGILAPDAEAGIARPVVRATLAYVEGQLGELIWLAGGRFDQAEPHHRRAVALASALARAEPGNPRHAFLEARVIADLAYLLLASGRPAEAEPLALRAAERARVAEASLQPGQPGADRVFLAAAAGASPLALARLGRAGAEPAARDLVERLRRLQGGEPDLADARNLLAEGLDELAQVVARDPARRAEALALEDEAVDRMAPLIAEHPSVAAYPPILARIRARRAAIRAALGHFDAARDDLDAARAVFEAEVGRVKGGPDPGRPGRGDRRPGPAGNQARRPGRRRPPRAGPGDRRPRRGPGDRPRRLAQRRGPRPGPGRPRRPRRAPLIRSSRPAPGSAWSSTHRSR